MTVAVSGAILFSSVVRSEASLEGHLQKLEGKELVKVVCMDLAVDYRALVRKHCPRQHFLACWKELDPVGSKNRGLLSLMRRHAGNLSAEPRERLAHYLRTIPALETIYRFKQKLTHLFLRKHQNRKNATHSPHAFCGRSRI